jgi:hypothetical protein
MPTAVNGQLYYSQDEVQAGLPQYHAALRQATGYTGQFSADPTQRFQQYISGATPEQQAASNALSNIYGSGAFTPGSTTVVQPNQAQQPPGSFSYPDWYYWPRDRSAGSYDRSAESYGQVRLTVLLA